MMPALTRTSGARVVDRSCGEERETSVETSSVSQADYLDTGEDLFRRDQFALARTRTDLTGALPRFGAGDVAFPERPGTALTRPNGIDGTASIAVVEDAIAVVLLAQRAAALREPRVEPRQLLDRLAA